jgi:hypothetical protein
MAKRLDAVQPRPGSNGKTYWTRLGTAWVADNGGISVVLEALPLPVLNDKGALETRFLLREPMERNQAPARGGGGRSFNDDLNDELKDDVPF